MSFYKCFHRIHVKGRVWISPVQDPQSVLHTFKFRASDIRTPVVITGHREINIPGSDVGVGVWGDNRRRRITVAVNAYFNPWATNVIYIYIHMKLLVKPEMLTSYIYGPTFGNAETVSASWQSVYTQM